ncbi:right-handed parallel beta-helix repeat-containing protein [Candidatus Sumerlaeota bacterium]|nr:right-handed parallel beta-helix repeat-containing protein [Candidatus Sumerlaeota bacterium]
MNRAFASATALLLILAAQIAHAAVYEVGPTQTLTACGGVPWESLEPGDIVRIHWREDAYNEKWVIGRQGTAEAWITVRGVPGPQGQLPVIDGRNATTRSQLNFWNESRGVIKIGGSNTPPDTTPQYIRIENLDIRSGRPPYSFTGRDGLTYYVNNCAALYVEKGEHLIFRNCTVHDCGNGIFAGSLSKDILVEYCTIYDNSIEDRYYEHNNYTECDGIIFQYNHFGPTRDGTGGNNLKDRSAGCVIRYNWIEGGNRQLDLVDSDNLYTLPSYNQTYVYGNILIEPDGAGNNQIAHYGGDSGEETYYRKGALHFYHNTVISTRSGNTTLLRLSSDGETADMRNNIIYATAGGSYLALMNEDGVLRMRHNWLNTGWTETHSGQPVTIIDEGGNITGAEPGFINFAVQNFRLQSTSPCLDLAASLHLDAATHPILFEYIQHAARETRTPYGDALDLGAYEYTIPPSASAQPSWLLLN